MFEDIKLNLVEKLSADVRALREENQILRDEINHLKGEQGKPDTKGNKAKSAEVEQDIVVKTDNVLFRKEKYYSPSTGKTYLAELPQGYEGQFGPSVKALAPDMYFEVGTSEPKILAFLKRFGLAISKGQLSNMLIMGQEIFHSESGAIYESGLRSTSYQQSDSTLTKVNGQNQNCHVVCNQFYSVYRSLPHKDRMFLDYVKLSQLLQLL